MLGRRMTDGEVLAHMREDTPLNRARKAFRGAASRIDGASRQRRAPDPIDLRRMEFDAVAEIAEALGDVPELAPPLTAESCAAFLEAAAASAGPDEAASLQEAARVLRREVGSRPGAGASRG